MNTMCVIATNIHDSYIQITCLETGSHCKRCLCGHLFMTHSLISVTITMFQDFLENSVTSVSETLENLEEMFLWCHM